MRREMIERGKEELVYRGKGSDQQEYTRQENPGYRSKDAPLTCSHWSLLVLNFIDEAVVPRLWPY